MDIITSIKASTFTFYRPRSTLRSRSRVDFGKFFGQAGLHQLTDLWLVCEYPLPLILLLVRLHQLTDLLQVVTSWREYFSFENSLVFGGDFGTTIENILREFTAPIHPLWLPFLVLQLVSEPVKDHSTLIGP
jgi:hypothetical protein